MLNRLTVSSLIQSVVVLMSTCMMALLCVSAWNSWERLTVTSRISVVADASSNLFKAMHNLRSDRASTIRSLNDDALVQPDIGKYLLDSRDAGDARRGRGARRRRIRQSKDAGSGIAPADTDHDGAGDRVM